MAPAYRKPREVLYCFALISLLLLPAGCTKKEPGGGSASGEEEIHSPVVARVGESSITAAEFKRYISQRPLPPGQGDSREEVEKRLDELVLEEVLYREALRLRLDREPEMRRRIRQMLTQRLLSQEVDEKVRSARIEEGELRDYYDRHRDAFNRPEQARLGDIFISLPSGASGEQKSGLKRKAEGILAEALEASRKGERGAFGALIDRYSDTPGGYRKGDTGFFDRQGNPAGIDRELAEAAFQMDRAGSIPERVIETPGGYHIVMLTGKRSAMEHPLEKVRGRILQRIRGERLKRKREEFLDGLRAKAEIAIDEKNLAEIATGLAAEKSESRKKPPPVPR